MAMATAAGGQGGGRRRRRGRRHAPMADINMTPFIDVMLVLLIIFMVAAPLLAAGVPIDLPRTAAGPLSIDKRPLTIAIDETGKLFLNDQPVEEADIVSRLAAMAKEGVDERIYLRGHEKVDYGKVARVMSTITAAGYKKVALVTDPTKGN